MIRKDRRAGWAAFLVAIPLLILVSACGSVSAGPQYAAYVMDARTGKTLRSDNADTRLHPASLTKMMTLYIAFQAIERGEISLDTPVKISAHAAAEPPSKLGLKPGQKVQLLYLIRAAAVKSANDAATAIGEAIGGSEAKFAERMNRTAKSIGMTRSTFQNANGLTRPGHLSTARDMSILGRHLFYDYPEYYNLFSRQTVDVGGRAVQNTNRRLLTAYRGADGIKTGFTNAAGSNLTASAERDGVRIIATVFGGSSSAARNQRVAELLDYGFSRAPRRVAVAPPQKPAYDPSFAFASRTAAQPVATASLAPAAAPPAVSGKRSGPAPRPATIVALAAARAHVVQIASASTKAPDARTAPEQIAAAEIAPGTVEHPDSSEALTEVALADTAADTAYEDTTEEDDRGAAPQMVAALAIGAAPRPRPGGIGGEAPIGAGQLVTRLSTAKDSLSGATDAPEPAATIDTASLAPSDDTDHGTIETTAAEAEEVIPAQEPEAGQAVALAAPELPVLQEPATAAAPQEPVPVTYRVTYSTAATPVIRSTRVSDPVVVRTGARASSHWGINVGRYNSRAQAEKVLLKTSLQQVDLLSGANRQIVSNSSGYVIQFGGLSKQQATLICQRLSAKQTQCDVFGS